MSHPYTRRVSTSLDRPPLRPPRKRAQYYRVPLPETVITYYDPLDPNDLVSSRHRKALFMSIERSPNPRDPTPRGLLHYLGLKASVPPHRPATPGEEAEYARLQREMVRKLSMAEEWERELQCIDEQLRDNRHVIKTEGQLTKRLAQIDRVRMVYEKEIWRTSTERVRQELQEVQEGLDYYLHSGPLQITKLYSVWKPHIRTQLPIHHEANCVAYLLEGDSSGLI